MGVTQLKDTLHIAVLLGVGFVAWRAYATGRAVGGSVVDGAARIYADLTTPDLSEPVIRLQSRYFSQDGSLTPMAHEVISTNYPNFYRVAFDGMRIKPAFSYLIDSGKPIKDSEYKR